MISRLFSVKRFTNGLDVVCEPLGEMGTVNFALVVGAAVVDETQIG